MANLDDDAFARIERAAEFGRSGEGTDPTPAAPGQIESAPGRRSAPP